jgi:hypothetical protein
VKVFPAFFCSATGRNEPMSVEQIYKKLSDSVVEMEEALAVETAHEALA